MPTTAPSLKKFSNELEPKELLEIMMILFQIARNRDVYELNRYLKHMAKMIGPEDFNTMVRRVGRMMGQSKCGDELCSDWLMSQLYELYKAYGTEPEEEI